MKRLKNKAAAVMLACSMCAAGMPVSAAKINRTDILDRVKWNINAYSVFSVDTLTQGAFEMDGLFTESHQCTVENQEELDRILSEYLLETPRKEFEAQYSEEFFDNYTLMLCTYLDPTHGRLTGHTLQSAYIEGTTDEDTVLYLDYTSTFGGSVCKTYCFEIMQVIVPNRLFPELGWEWHCTELLQPGLVRFSFEDAETGETLKVPGDIGKMTILPTIGYYDAESGNYAYADMASLEFSYDMFWEASQYMDADILDFSLSQASLPEGWTLPEDYRTVTKYDNGSMDITFRLRRDIPEAGKVRVTLRDADTGALIVSRDANGDFGHICTNIGIKMENGEWAYTGPILVVDANPCVMRNDLMLNADLCEFSLWLMPGGYTSEAIYSNGKVTPEGEITVTQYDNGSADVVFYLHFKPTGDVSGDGVTEVSDAVAVQKYLLSEADALTNWKAADYNNDNRLDARDLTLMIRAMLA